MRNSGTTERGQTLVFVVLMMAVIVMFVAVLNGSVIHDVRVQVRQSDASFALQAAESGIDRALWCLNHSAECASPYTGETAAIGETGFTTTVTTVGSERKVVSVGGSDKEQRALQVYLTTSPVVSGASFHYGIQVGIGGLSMDQNSRVQGSVYSNGPISGANNTNIDADASAAVSPSLAVDQQQTTFLSTGAVGRTAANIDAAQSFVPSTTGMLTKVSVNIRKQGGPANATLRITHDKGGTPETSSVASWTVTAASVTTTLAWYDYTLATPMPVVAGRTYWIVFDAATANFLNYWIWGTNNDASYALGTGMYADNYAAPSAWNGTSVDFMFKSWMGGAQTSSISTVTIGHDAAASSIVNSTINNDARYQTITGSTVVGTSYPESTPPPQVQLPLTQDDITNWETTAAAAAPEVFPNGGTLTLTDGAVLPSEKINGNLTIANGAIVTLMGPVWVKGDLYLDQNATINLAPAFGSNGTVIIVDNQDAPATSGRVTLMNGATINGTGVSGSNVLVLSTNRSMALGTSAAIFMKQGSGGAIFYSTDGMVDIENGVNVKALTGQGVHLANGAIVHYEQGLIDSSFADGPGGAWAVKPETWQEVPGESIARDNASPTVPQNLRVNGATPDYIWIGWDASTDAVGVVNYRIYRCERTAPTTPCQPTFLLETNSLDPQYEDYLVYYYETYEYEVTALDAAGNESGRSNRVAQVVPSGGGSSPIMAKPPVSGAARTPNTEISRIDAPKGTF